MGMNIVRSLAELKDASASVVTVGTFDGVHAGHVSILARLIARSRERSARSVVVTFTPHPRSVVKRGPVGLLTSLAERLALLAAAGVDVTYLVEFTYEFSRQTPSEFFDRTIVPLGTREMIIGHDHLFGRDREAGIDRLRELAAARGIETTVMDPVTIGGDIVSSSAIRDCLQKGDVAGANRLLGRPYALRGSVVRGDGRGATIGFATANLVPDESEKIVPANGVYIVGVRRGGEQYGGIMNIGVRPTFQEVPKRIIEAHLLGFAGTLYGETLEVTFLARLRDERRFPSVADLVEQIKADRRAAEEFIRTQTYSSSSVH